jgi:hypothetical protein
LVPALAQKEIYPVKDSHSYISPYTQRDHAFTDNQHDQSNEVTWSKETNVTSADNLDWVVNEQGPHSRLFPGTPAATLAQQEAAAAAAEKYRIETHSIIIPYVVRDQAWNFDHHDNTNITAYKEDIPAGFKEGIKWVAVPVEEADAAGALLVNCTDAEEEELAAEIIANVAAGVPAPNATCLTAAARTAAKASNCTNATNGTNGSNATNATCNASNKTNATNATKPGTPAAAPAAPAKVKTNTSTVANASKIAAKKVEVPKVTTPVATKPVAKKPAAANQTTPVKPTASNATKPVTKSPVAANKTQVSQPVVVSKVNVNKSDAAVPKAKVSADPEFAPKVGAAKNATNSTINSTTKVVIKRKSNTTNATTTATKSTVKK